MAIKHHTIPPPGTVNAIDEPQWAEGHDVDSAGITFHDGSTQTTANAPGSNKQVIFNGTGAFAASSGFLWDDGAHTLTIDGGNAVLNSNSTMKITSGAGTGTGDGSTLFLNPGNGGSLGGNGGGVNSSAGSASGGNGLGGGFIYVGGNGAGTGVGGGLTFSAGAGGATGAGGGIAFTAGSAQAGLAFGAQLTLPGGPASGVAADVTLYAAGVDAAHAGRIIFQDANLDNSLIIDPNGNVAAQCIGSGPGTAVGDTQGFFYLPSVAGKPTGTPGTSYTDAVPCRFDITNKKLWIYAGGAWIGVLLA